MGRKGEGGVKIKITVFNFYGDLSVQHFRSSALLAQLVERTTLNRVVVGSIPTLGARFDSSVGRAQD